MNHDGWDSLADWYDQKQGETGDLWHRALIDPPLLKMIGETRDKDVLDLGCGNGYLSRRLARAGARITAIDGTGRMIKNARGHDPLNSLKIAYLVANASDLTSIVDDSFDIVFANMSLMDIEDAQGAISEVGRVLRKGGRFVASISHPCFDNGANSGWLIEKVFFEPTIYRRIRAYRKPFSESIPWRVLNRSDKSYTLAYHRPLNWYAKTISESGMAIFALEEPEGNEEFLEKEGDAAGFREVPLHLVIGALKL